MKQRKIDDLDFKYVSEVASVPINHHSESNRCDFLRCLCGQLEKKNIVKRCAIQCAGDPFHRQKKRHEKGHLQKYELNRSFYICLIETPQVCLRFWHCCSSVRLLVVVVVVLLLAFTVASSRGEPNIEDDLPLWKPNW